MPHPGFGASQHTQQSSQYAVLTDYLSGNASTSEEILENLIGPVEKEVSSSGDLGKVEERLTTTWRSIVAKAAETPFTDPSISKLVDLVVALQNRPDVQKDNKAFQVQEMTIWRDLPMFGWQMREAWNLGTSWIEVLAAVSRADVA